MTPLESETPTRRLDRAGAYRKRHGFTHPNHTTAAEPVQDSGPRRVGEIFPGLVFDAGLRSVNHWITVGNVEEASKLLEAMGMSWATLFDRRVA